MPLSTVKPNESQIGEGLEYINANLRRIVGGGLEPEITRKHLNLELSRVEGEIDNPSSYGIGDPSSYGIENPSSYGIGDPSSYGTVVLFHLDGRKFKVSADDLREAKQKAAPVVMTASQSRDAKASRQRDAVTHPRAGK